MKTNIIYNEDCIGSKGMRMLSDNSIDLILTDPFYVPPNIFSWKNFDDFYWGFNKKWLVEIKRLLKKEYHMFIFFSPNDMSRFEVLLKGLDFKIMSRLVWHYRNAGGRCRGNDRFGRTYEFIFHCSSGKHLNFPDKWNDARFDVQQFSIPQSNYREGKYHEFQKPLGLIERLIEFGSFPKEIVLDPFMGSGTTAVACVKLSRRYIGFETKGDYVKIAKKRLSEVQLQLL